jgi:N-acyl-L-homoserine lactone synthetase
MFHVIDHQQLSRMDEVYYSMFTDRAQQFVARHKWSLRLEPTGFEIDEYDDCLTTYCVVEEGGRHLASLRLRPASAGSMVEKHFPSLWKGLEARLGDGFEITRFCAAPALSPDRRLTAVSDLLLGLCRHCQRTGIQRLFGVVFPSGARVIRHAGWPALVVKDSEDGRGTLQLAEWRASERVAWDIQERREFREEIWCQRKAAVSQLAQRLVA